MFVITKAGYEYFRKHQNHIVNNELIQTISWVTDKTKAAKFETVEAARMTIAALKYQYDNLQIINDLT